MFATLVRHQVRDFDTWKLAFDADEPARVGAGFVMHNMHVDADDPNAVVVFLAAPSLSSINGFLNMPALDQAMAAAGVVGEPSILVMENKTLDLGGPDAKAGVVLQHPVADFAAWKAAFDAHSAARSDAGIAGHSVNTLAADGNQVVAYMQSDDMAKIKGLVNSADLKSAMAAAGVTGPPTLWFVNHVEMKTYA
ncbi:MAG: hypothetical protein ACI9MR_001761 [Myxococcota bacterium]|jgi:hypothetical protein